MWGLLSYEACCVKYLVLTAEHILFLFFAALMVVAEKMENGMNAEECQLALKGVVVFACLLQRLFHGNYDVSQRYLALFTVCALKILFGKVTVEEREGENVGGTVDTSEIAVELVDALVIGQGNGDLRFEFYRLVLQSRVYRSADNSSERGSIVDLILCVGYKNTVHLRFPYAFFSGLPLFSFFVFSYFS